MVLAEAEGTVVSDARAATRAGRARGLRSFLSKEAATGVEASAGAYETALAGGGHAGFLRNNVGRATPQLERGIASLERQTAEHHVKIARPERFIDEWASLDPRQQKALLTDKWPSDIARQQEQLDIMRGIVESRRT